MYKALLLLMLLPLAPPHTRPYTLLIPAVHYDYANSRDNRGVAWQDNNRPFLANRLGAEYWYNASSYRFVDNGRALPIIRPHNAADVIATLGENYDGYLLIMNEPNGETQDNLTPLEAVDFVNEVYRALPHAVMVGPNLAMDDTSLVWVSDYLNAGGRPFDIWGIHIYEGGYSPQEAITSIQGFATAPVWITEIGTRDPALMSEWLTEAVAASIIFVYTARNGCCHGAFDLIVDDQLTKVGHVWRE